MLQALLSKLAQGFLSSFHISSLTFGRNPAPVDMENLPLFTGFYLSQVVQDFFHQQYDTMIYPLRMLLSGYTPETGWLSLAIFPWLYKQTFYPPNKQGTTVHPQWNLQVPTLGMLLSCHIKPIDRPLFDAAARWTWIPMRQPTLGLPNKPKFSSDKYSKRLSILEKCWST